MASRNRIKGSLLANLFRGGSQSRTTRDSGVCLGCQLMAKELDAVDMTCSRALPIPFRGRGLAQHSRWSACPRRAPGDYSKHRVCISSTETKFKSRRESCRKPGIKTVPGPAKSRPDPSSSILVTFFQRFPVAARSELAIRCALNRVGKSMDIQRLCPNFDRRHAR